MPASSDGTIVLLGASGFVGRAFQMLLSSRATPYYAARRGEYCAAAQLDALLQRQRPAFLVNAAGYAGRPNVDACEHAKAACLQANAVLPGVIREVCERRGIPWGHVSSGCIYTGARSDGAGFNERDVPNFTFRRNNCSFYSGCKALGEEVLQGAEECYVWRPRMPFNHVDAPKNYLSKLMRYERLLDVRNSLSDLDEFVAACIDCWQLGVDYGAYNLTNSGSVDTREVVELIQRSGVCRRRFRFFDSEAEFMRIAAKTPRSSCVLDNGKAVRSGLRLSHVVEALERALRNWRPLADDWPPKPHFELDPAAKRRRV